MQNAASKQWPQRKRAVWNAEAFELGIQHMQNKRKAQQPLVSPTASFMTFPDLLSLIFAHARCK